MPGGTTWRCWNARAVATRLNEDEIRSHLKEAFYLLPIQRELLDVDRERAGGRDFQGKTPLELLQVYLDGKDLPADRRETLLQYARDLVNEPIDAPSR